MLCKSALSRTLKTLVIAMTLPLLTGCIAEQRLSWSPDGKKLALVGSDGVRISTDGGFHLSDAVEVDAQIVSWFPDSKRMVVVTKDRIENWADLEKSIDRREVDEIKDCAAQFLKELENCHGNYAACRDALIKQGFNGSYLQQALYYLRATASEKMQKIIGHEWRTMSLGDSIIPFTKVKTFAVDDKSGLQLIHTLVRTTDVFESVKVSPSNEFVCLVDNDENLLLSSTVPPPKGFLEIGRGFGNRPDWDVNTDVIYGLRAALKKEKSGVKNYQELVSIDARKPNSMKRLLALPTAANKKVRATVDGNLLYASTTTIKAGKNAKAISVDTLNMLTLASGKTKTVYQCMKGDQLDNFEVSPDGKNVSIPNSSGGIRVVALKDSKTRSIVPGNPKNEQDLFTPVWKDNDELCYENIALTNGIDTVSLYSLKAGKSKSLSKNWPIEAVTALLGKPKDNQLTFGKMVEDLKDQKNRPKL